MGTLTLTITITITLTLTLTLKLTLTLTLTRGAFGLSVGASVCHEGPHRPERFPKGRLLPMGARLGGWIQAVPTGLFDEEEDDGPDDEDQQSKESEQPWLGRGRSAKPPAEQTDHVAVNPRG